MTRMVAVAINVEDMTIHHRNEHKNHSEKHKVEDKPRSQEFKKSKLKPRSGQPQRTENSCLKAEFDKFILLNTTREQVLMKVQSMGLFRRPKKLKGTTKKIRISFVILIAIIGTTLRTAKS